MIAKAATPAVAVAEKRLNQLWSMTNNQLNRSNTLRNERLNYVLKCRAVAKRQKGRGTLRIQSVHCWRRT
jgi:hypothetical protein